MEKRGSSILQGGFLVIPELGLSQTRPIPPNQLLVSVLATTTWAYKRYDQPLPPRFLSPLFFMWIIGLDFA